MSRTVLLTLALLTAAFAGCINTASVDPASVDDFAPNAAEVGGVLAKLSPLLGDLDIIHQVLDVETAHGLVNVDLYLPDVPEGMKMPLILVASPYNNANSPIGGSKQGDDNWVSLPLYEFIRAELMPRGYAFAQMDILGTRNSGGCMGIMNAAEREATATVIDFLGEQHWSNGKVGMIGKSYLGLSQIGAAVENPEHLVTIVPISAPTQDYAYHYYNGVPYALNHITNVLYYGAYSLPQPDGDAATYGPRYAERAPCAPEAIAGGAYTMGDYSERWQARDYRPLIPDMRDDISVFFIHGLKDWNVKPDHIMGVYNEIPGPKMALLGQWAHDYPNINNYDADTFGEREDWFYTLHRWFDHWLLDIDTGIMDEAASCPVQSQGHDGAWRCLNAFPPLPETPGGEGDSRDGLTWRTLFPGEGLRDEPTDISATFTDAPADTTTPVAAMAATDTAPPNVLGIPRALRFDLPAQNETLRFAGAPTMSMRVSTTSAYNAHLTAALAVVRDGGTPVEFTWGFQSLRHRTNLETAEPVIPAERYDVTFQLYPVDMVLKPGDSLVLILRGESPGPNGGILQNPEPGVILVEFAQTSLSLPVVPVKRGFEPISAAALPATHLLED